MTSVAGAAMVAVSTAVASAASVAKAAGPYPLPNKRPPGWIAIGKVSDGCGQEGSVFRAHDQTYKTDNGQELTVDFNEACNIHDAAYSGALVWDSINGNFIDYSEPKWTKAAINEKFLRDLQRLCFRAFPDAAGMGAEAALHTCLTSNDVRKFGTWGAVSFYDIVNSIFGANPRERVNLTAEWKNTAPGWPVCDIGGAHPMTITQNGREVTAVWHHGTSGQLGRFQGTLTTGGEEGEDVVVGEYTVTDGVGGPKVSGGAMTFKIISPDKIDFTDTAAGGTLVREGRSIQGLLRSAAVPSRCRYKPPPKTKPAAAKRMFTLVASLTEVKNVQGAKLQIDATGMSADLDHTGQYGGAGNGGDWKVHYTWQVPQTLIPGNKYTITLGVAVSAPNQQPLSIGMNALAPDFGQQLIVTYPNPSNLSKSYEGTLAADQKDSKEIIVTIGFESSYVIYHYRPAGK
jgi:hypothetical protein